MKALLGITCFRDHPYIHTCLDDLIAHTTSPHDISVFHNFQITDDIEKAVKPRVHCWGAAKENLHLADAWNRTIAPAFRHWADGKLHPMYDLVFIMNDDLSPPPVRDGVDWLSVVVKYFEEHPDIGGVSPEWKFSNRDEYYKLWEKDDWRRWERRPFPGMQGYCMAFRGQALADIYDARGFVFNERFPLMWEDLEIIYHIHKAGWNTQVLTDVPFCHWGSRTIEQVADRNSKYMLGKQLFHEITGAPITGGWTAANGMYYYQKDGKLVAFGLEDR